MAKRDADPSQAVRLGEGGPHIDPRVQNPQAIAYAEAMRNRKAPAPIPKYTEPVNGGPTLPIPLLDGDPQKGSTMAEQGARERGPRVQGGVANAIPSELAPSLMGGAGISMTDTLPDAARQDPAYREGVGAMYASSQPALARKYGVIRQGQHVPPQKLFGAPAGSPPGQRGQLSPQTLQGLEALNVANGDGNMGPPEPGPAPTPKAPAKAEEKPLTEEEQKEVLGQLDNFDFAKFRSILKRDVLNNDSQREIIEKRLKPLDIVEVIMKGRVSQTVPIVPDRFEATFQSYKGEEDLQIKRWITGEIKTLEGPDRYFEDKYSLMGLTIAIKAVNRTPLPDCYNADGELDEEMFWAKYKMVSRFDFHMLSSLHVNWIWFDARVRKLFVAEELGNG